MWLITCSLSKTGEKADNPRVYPLVTATFNSVDAEFMNLVTYALNSFLGSVW